MRWGFARAESGGGGKYWKEAMRQAHVVEKRAKVARRSAERCMVGSVGGCVGE